MGNVFDIGNNLLLVDTLNLCYRFKHSGYKVDNNITIPDWATLDDMVELMREDLESSYFFTELLNTILSFSRSYKAKKIICVADNGGSKWRKELYPEYKGDRAEKYADQTLAEQAANKVFMEHYRRALEDLEASDEVELIVEYGIEADDLAAYITTTHFDKYEHIWIISSDQDMDLLLSENVSRCNWATKSTWMNITKTAPRPKEITLENWSEHYPHTFEQYLSIKALTANEDNIHGVKGIGPKRGLDLINKYGDLEGLIAALPIKTSKAAYIQALNGYVDQLRLNYKLMNLRNTVAEVVPLDVSRRVDLIV